MTTSAKIAVTVTPEAATRISGLGLQAEINRMIDYARRNLPGASNLKVVLYHRDEVGEEPGLAVEVYTPFESFDPTARTRWKIGEWLVSEFPPAVLEHITMDYLPEGPFTL